MLFMLARTPLRHSFAAALLCLALPAQADSYDPLAYAQLKRDVVDNREAVIPSQCYTKTDGVSNPCYTCHTVPNGTNYMGDWELQEEYAFSDVGLTNYWSNLFADRGAVIAGISDDEALAYVRGDNYGPLREAMASIADFPGWRPDLDYSQGFDADGFANDGSWWRAFRYKPFLGTFWPTNGSTDDVLIRLPAKFWKTAEGTDSYAIYKINLAIVEAAMTVDDRVSNSALYRMVEPIDEALAGADLDGNGTIGGTITAIRGLPARYVGAARDEPVQRHLYPKGTEFLHTVRYIDPDNAALLSARMKEVRYSKKMFGSDTWSLLRQYEKELQDKSEGLLPVYVGSAFVGLMNGFGWQYQGYIEDAQGRLRLQSYEEHLFCMGCHSTIGVTADQSFGFPRKVPGAVGWAHQSLAGIPDHPQAGSADPEILTYFARVKGGDEFRSNQEILDRFFPDGTLDEAEVRRAAPGGDADTAWLLAPSRERALKLNKAYMALVREQSFERGRDAVAAPTVNVHEVIVNGSTDLGLSGQVYTDGRIWLDWSNPYGAAEIVETAQSAYIAYYGRPADPAGLKYWAACLTAAGGDLDALIEAFANSDEATARFGGMTDEERLDNLYLQLFGRLPDAAGKAFYLSALAEGRLTHATIALDVLNGAKGDDATIIDNKVATSAHFTTQVVAFEAVYGSDDIDAARAVLSSVGILPASVDAAKASADALIAAMAQG